MDIRQFTNHDHKSSYGYIPNQIPSSKDAGTTNLTDQDKSAIDKGTQDELSNELVQEYLKFLDQNEISQGQVFSVLDKIISGETLKWEFNLFKKIPVIFTIRPAWINSLVLKRVQEDPPQTYAAFNDVVNTCNLAGSLLRYGKINYSVENEDQFKSVESHIQKLPFIIKAQLVRHLAIFDRVVAVATSDWAVENFQIPSAGEFAQIH